MKPDETKPLQPGEIIQIMPPHTWAGCLAVVHEAKAFGCQAYVTGPVAEGTGDYYIRLAWEAFERLNVSTIVEPVR